MIYNADSLVKLRELEAESAYTCVTSPPYWGLRDYGVDGQLGLEETPELFVTRLVEIFREVKRVLRKDGTLWLNLGDSYAGSSMNGGDQSKRVGGGVKALKELNHSVKSFGIPKGLKQKDLVGIPWMVAFALRADGWYLRSDIIWHKPNPMPESCRDRPTKSHEYIFLFSKSSKYYYDQDAIREPHKESSINRMRYGWNGNLCEGHKMGGIKNIDKMETCHPNGRNKRTVWTVNTKSYTEAHFATYPEELIKPCILAGCPEYGTVLDPFSGAGTTGVVAMKLNRKYIGIELNKEYCDISIKRLKDIYNKHDQIDMFKEEKELQLDLGL